ncbi:MAG TPA: protease modulator HflC [Hyphomicrobiales bacterium]|nr:protease modulator HflC [Hyphomicrobiales bacterium]
MRNAVAALVVAIVVIVVAINATYVVGQAQQALVLRFGNPIRIVHTPGLRLKAPFIDTVIVLDKRILPLDLPEQEVIASDQKRLVVDAFARYRIADPLRFYQAVGTVDAANNRLITFLNSSLRQVLGNASFLDVVRDKRQPLMESIRDLVNGQARSLGLDVVDVRIRRADLPEANSQAIYRRMQTERQRQAAELRAEGGEAAQRIRAQADRQATVIVADATRDADRLRGEGDATRNGIYAAAYGKDPDFFAFYRSMQAYEAALKPGNTRFVLAPNSPFFRYLNGAPPAQAPASGDRGR